jgi:ABC-type lipoprotein export system ATPase subunit
VAVTFVLGRVTFGYEKDRPILRDVSLNLPAGRVIVVLGVSGLGKTTLLNLLALLWERRIPHGSIRYGDDDYNSLSAGRRHELRTREFGLVPQVPHFLSGFTCRQNLHIPAALAGLSAKAQKERIDRILDAGCPEDVRERLDDYPVRLSTGQRQRLSALRAVIHDPAVLFADEPVSNLDGKNKERMLDLFRQWKRGELELRGPRERTLLLICHELETAWSMARDRDDLLVFMRPTAEGARAELKTRAEFVAAEQDGPAALRRHLMGDS